jgi:hypothetical protein
MTGDLMSTPQPFRGLHYDLARGNYDSLDDLRRLVRFCAECGLNELVLYMEDLWRYAKHPDLSNAHAYALADMGELAGYAAAHGVDFIPSLTTIGHSKHILEKPAYAHLAFPGPHADFDVFNPAVNNLFADLFDEVLPHFQSPYVHINGDEVRYTALSEEARAFVREKGMGALYGTGLGRLARMIVERGRRPIVWHDMLLHHPDALDYLPSETIICYWFYDSQPAFPAIDYFRGRGFDVLAAPGLIVNRSRTPDLARALPNVYGQCRAAAESLAHMMPGGACLGTLTTIWEDVTADGGVLPIYATGRWTQDAEAPYWQVLADFAQDVFGIERPELGEAWIEAARLGGAVRLLEEARDSSTDVTERVVLEGEIAVRHAALQPLTAALTTDTPAKHVEAYRALQATAAQLAACGTAPSQDAPAPAPVPLLCADALRPGEHGCRIVSGETPFGHRLLVLTNGLVTVSLLPDFAATMVEWVLFDGEPKAFIDAGGYYRWAGESPRDLRDPGLLSPWGVSRVGGWRETIFYNARLNPSSLWGYPATVEMLVDTPEEIAVACTTTGNVAEVRRVVRLRAGQPVIAIESTATNRIVPGWLGIQPNVGYRIPGAAAASAELIDGAHTRLLADHNGTMLFTPQGKAVSIHSRVSGRGLDLRFHADEVQEILTDVGGSYFTLEPFSRPQWCATGEGVRLRLEYTLR